MQARNEARPESTANEYEAIGVSDAKHVFGACSCKQSCDLKSWLGVDYEWTSWRQDPAQVERAFRRYAVDGGGGQVRGFRQEGMSIVSGQEPSRLPTHHRFQISTVQVTHLNT